MKIDLPKLNYAEDGLVPYISKQTIQYHYGKHTAKYYETVNELIKDTKFEKHKTLEDLITSGLINDNTKLFNNVCQAWNHTFYWQSIGPSNESTPSVELNKAINRDFGSMDTFQKKFTETFLDGFGSMWTWLVLVRGELRIVNTPNARTPLTTKDQIPLLVIDGWEHAWYLDHPADKSAHIKAWWNVVNWRIVNDRFKTNA